jgi:hypothetical protein
MVSNSLIDFKINLAECRNDRDRLFALFGVSNDVKPEHVKSVIIGRRSQTLALSSCEDLVHSGLRPLLKEGILQLLPQECSMSLLAQRNMGLVPLSMVLDGPIPSAQTYYT